MHLMALISPFKKNQADSLEANGNNLNLLERPQKRGKKLFLPTCLNNHLFFFLFCFNGRSSSHMRL